MYYNLKSNTLFREYIFGEYTRHLTHPPANANAQFSGVYKPDIKKQSDKIAKETVAKRWPSLCWAKN